MAKIILNTSENPINIWKISILGLVSGGIYCGLFLILKHYLPSTTASQVTLIVVATIGLLVMVVMKSSRPLIVTLGTLVSLWYLESLTNHLALMELIISSLVIYTIAYSFFGWVSYIKKTSVAIMITVITIIVAHVISTSAMIQ